MNRIVNWIFSNNNEKKTNNEIIGCFSFTVCPVFVLLFELNVQSSWRKINYDLKRDSLKISRKKQSKQQQQHSHLGNLEFWQMTKTFLFVLLRKIDNEKKDLI